ncbi:MAG: MBL fold metallo-hydrolase [Terriglobales bacterium]|jgi:7,8-dihydropterin-6-yl-methyl-4-(beta-D-ribofuranosyl)aminobenzene 5'-phosphate synthase
MHHVSRFRWIKLCAAVLALWFPTASVQAAEAQAIPAPKVPSTAVQIHGLKVTLLSTMLVGSTKGLGEWGFSALIEADGHPILLDTGSHPDTVLQNARDLNIDLSNVKEVILTHNHWDHISGLMPLRQELMKRNRSALSVVYVARGIFYSRPAPGGEDNQMIALKNQYEATGGRFIELEDAAQIFPGAWLTGPVPRKYPEHNWSSTGKVQTPGGLVEDTIPEDQSLVLNTPEGLVVVTGCGHAGIINILTFARAEFPNEPVNAVIGGLHLFPATDEQLDWTADKMKEFKVANLMGAHCTGIEAVYHIRERLGLPRASAVVGSVGSSFVLGEGLHPGPLAK